MVKNSEDLNKYELIFVQKPIANSWEHFLNIFGPDLTDDAQKLVEDLDQEMAKIQRNIQNMEVNDEVMWIIRRVENLAENIRNIQYVYSNSAGFVDTVTCRIRVDILYPPKINNHPILFDM